MAENEIITNAEDGKFTTLTMQQDHFFDCKHGYVFADPAHNLYQSMCKFKKCEANCMACKDFEPDHKAKWFLQVEEDLNGIRREWDMTFFSEEEARTYLANYIKSFPNLEIWWFLSKKETIAGGHIG